MPRRNKKQRLCKFVLGAGGGWVWRGAGWREENKVHYGRCASGVYGHNLARVEGELA